MKQMRNKEQTRKNMRNQEPIAVNTRWQVGRDYAGAQGQNRTEELTEREEKT